MTARGLPLILALSFDILNGSHDSANLAATVIASRMLSSRSALPTPSRAEPVTRMRWTLGREMLADWFLTIPACAVLAGLLCLALGR